MNIELNKISNTLASIKVTLNEADYQPEVEKKIKDYSKKISLKGFRPGKVPAALIKKMYGKSILAEEVQHKLSHVLFDYIKEKELMVVGQPQPDETGQKEIDWDTQKDFDFTYKVGLATAFTYDLSSMVLTNYEIEVGEDYYQKQVENLRKRFGTSEVPESTGEGDFIYGLVSRLADKEMEEKAEAAFEAQEGEVPEEKSSLIVSKNSFIPLSQVTAESLPLFLNRKVADKVVFDIKNLFNENPARSVGYMLGISEEEAEKMEGEFEIEIQSFNRVVLAELNEDFFMKATQDENVKDEEALYAKLKENMIESFKNDNYFLQEMHIKKTLENVVVIELPDEFLKNLLYDNNEGKHTMEQIEKEYTTFSKTLKWSLIRDKIAKDESINVEQDELLEHVKALIKSEFGFNFAETPEITQRLNQIAMEFLFSRKNNNYDRMYGQLLEKKLLAALRENMPLESKKISLNDFEALFKEFS